MTEVINIHHKLPYDVYCGRAGHGEDGYFGNPTYSFEKYKPYFQNRLETDPEFKKRILALKGKKLGCFCAPNECHVMVIIEYLDGVSVFEQMKQYTRKMGKEIAENIFDTL